MCEQYSSHYFILIVDKIISPNKKEASMFEEITKVIQSDELCTMRLIHPDDIEYYICLDTKLQV